MWVKISIIILLLLGFCSSAWLNVQQHDRNEHDKKILSDQLADLKSQAAQMSDADPAATPSPDPSDSPLVAGQSIIKISLYGVAITVADPVSDLVYGEVQYGGTKAAGLTTESLLAKYPYCKAGALGTLVRTKSRATASPSNKPSPSSSYNPIRTPANLPFSKTVAGYTYSYKSPTFTCATDQAGNNTVVAAVAALKNQALPTMVAQ